MAYLFPSDEWIASFKEKINSNPNYRQSGAKWEHGTIALVMELDPQTISELKNNPAGGGQFEQTETGVGIWLDLYRGECREAKRANLEDAQKAKFIIRSNYPNWKTVLRKQLDPVKGMMQGKLKLKGDLPTIVRFVKAAQDLVDSATMVDTKLIDE